MSTERYCWSCAQSGGEMLHFGNIHIHDTPTCRSLAGMSDDNPVDDMARPLQAVSNVIELKPGHKYLLVFKDTDYTPDHLEALAYQLDRMGYQCLAVGIYGDKADVQVIEVPAKEHEG